MKNNPNSPSLNQIVQEYWDNEACGTSSCVVGDTAKNTREYFDSVEKHRYKMEPFIHQVAKFSLWQGKKILEIGVGAGTDHLQFARSGAECYGIDLTDLAIETTRARFKEYGLKSELKRVNAQKLPFDDNSFDMVYCWGVIQHSECPEMIIKEIHRVLRSEGTFIGMMYKRYSAKFFKLWIKHALLKGKPWLSLKDVIWNNQESPGTKGYTIPELKILFAEFRNFTTQTFITDGDTQRFPRCFHSFFPDWLGTYVALRGLK